VQRVTIADIARRLNISKASVSYAINGRPGVSEETRSRVLALAAELGFHPSQAAVALSAARTRTVGLVIARDPDIIGAEAYYLQQILGIEEYLNEVDASLLLRIVEQGGTRDLAVYRRWWQQGRVDGFILYDELVDDPRLRLVHDLGVPAVLLGAQGAEDGLSHLVSAETETVAVLLDHLQGLGHRHIGHVSGPPQLVHEQTRTRLIAAECRRRGLRLSEVASSYSFDDGARSSGDLLDRRDRPTALVLGNDVMATAALRAAEDRRLSVPGDVSVVAWDDSALCQLTRPALTAIDNHPRARGRLAAELLFALVASSQPVTVVAPPGDLRVRDSTGPAPVA
jgi:DNA-binding LacI/PurR family transcriptional regulator